MKPLLTTLCLVALPALADPVSPVTVATADPAALKRANEILAQLTLEEKVSLCRGNSTFYVNAIPRVGLKEELSFSDGPHNVRPEVKRDSWGHVGGTADFSTSLPPLTALSATWDPALAALFGDTLGAEARDRRKDVILGPGLNIMRTPLNGRNFEYMGEDPFLASAMVVPLVRAIQAQDVAACVKHYAANNQELNRLGVDVEMDERTLQEIYLPAFRAAVVDGGALVVMGAYNKFRGVHCCHNDYLLNQVLKKEWGFPGFVVSDWGGTHDTLEAALGGLDVEMDAGSSIRYFKKPLLEAVKAGKVPESVVDDKARRVLYVMAKIHKLDGVPRQPGSRNTPEHQAAARKIAESAIVLLKNDGGVLPFDKAAVRKLLVVGDNAAAKYCEQGGSAMGKPPYEVTPLDGLKKCLGPGTEIEFVPSLKPAALVQIPESSLLATNLDVCTRGWSGEFFANPKLEGRPAAKTYDAKLEFDWKGQAPAAGVPATGFSVRWTAKLLPQETGTYLFGITCDDGARLFINGTRIVDLWTDGPARTAMAQVPMEAGRDYEVRVEYYQAGGDAVFSLGWRPPSAAKLQFEDLVAKARAADAVLIFTGTDHHLEEEGNDRADIALPAGQDETVAALAGANPRTAVVNLSGAPVAMPWIGEAKAVVQYWFSGMEGGNALASVLFGEANPSGKLPFTFPKRLADSPAHALNAYQARKCEYREGVLVGYRWFDTKKIDPQFPFGHGLSYTTFQYGPVIVMPVRLKKDIAPTTSSYVEAESFYITVPVTNTGKIAGAEVVQLYLHKTDSKVSRPEQELKGFQKVFLQPGETREVRFGVSRLCLPYWDEAAKRWETESGRYEVRIGSSSRDIRARENLDL